VPGFLKKKRRQETDRLLYLSVEGGWKSGRERKRKKLKEAGTFSVAFFLCLYSNIP